MCCRLSTSGRRSWSLGSKQSAQGPFELVGSVGSVSGQDVNSSSFESDASSAALEAQQERNKR